MVTPLSFKLDRSSKTSLTDQICKGISAAIESGVLAPGARLPSWLDLAAQLGVARGTVRSAYEKLSDAQLVVASRAGGTRVADRPHVPLRSDEAPDPGSFFEMYRDLTAGPAIFQMGVPAQETLPAKLFTRARHYGALAESNRSALYPDPRGELELRREIAAYLAIARGMVCSPSQVFITSGFSGGLGLTLRVLSLEGRKVWVENPGFFFTRHGLELARLQLAPIPVDENGINVEYGLQHEPDAALVVVTPGQQAPLGVTLSLERRLQLLEWAARERVWIIEDDYLSELQLKGRAAPALASLDRAGRVIHIGSFSKTLTPALRLGFLVVPPALASQFAEVAACLVPAPWPSIQVATARFLRDGHYMRHLRRTKRLYLARRDALLDHLGARGLETMATGFAVLLRLPDGVSDASIAADLLQFGLAPTALSPWYTAPASARSGLLLGVATAPERHLARACDQLQGVIQRHIGLHSALNQPKISP
jgi:GntR family transcriptional regulator / MocR family aminotransferase